MDQQTQEKLLDIVERNYEEIADDFNQTRKKHLWPEIIELAKDVKNGDRVLDVGCGNGRLLGDFTSKEINYTGVDSSEKLINFAKSNFPEYKFLVGNILELDKIPEIDFNYVFCIALMHHIPGEDLRIKALNQLANKVKADGRITLTVWNLWSQRKFRKLIWKTELEKLVYKMFPRFRKAKSRDPEFALRTSGDFGDMIFKGFKQKSERYYHAFTKHELKKIIKQAGLKIDKLYKDKYNYYAILRK
jgi:SAM-dependent methyltransferase